MGHFPRSARLAGIVQCQVLYRAAFSSDFLVAERRSRRWCVTRLRHSWRMSISHVDDGPLSPEKSFLKFLVALFARKRRDFTTAGSTGPRACTCRILTSLLSSSSHYVNNQNKERKCGPRACWSLSSSRLAFCLNVEQPKLLFSPLIS